jgi:hypothetical protein
MPKYEVRVVVDMGTTWEATTPAEALRMADEWVRDEYGDLAHKCDLVVKEIA